MPTTDKVIRELNQAYNAETIPDDLQELLLQRFQIEKNTRKKRARRKRQLVSLAAVTGVFALFLGGAAQNAEVRAFASEIPFLGKVVEVILGESYSIKNEKSEVDVDVPKIDANTDVAQLLNKKYLEQGKAAYEQAIKELNELNNQNFSSTTSFNKILDDDRFLVIARQTTKSAGSTSEERSFDTIDKQNNVLLSLPLLFKDESFLQVLSDEVKKQMTEQMAADPNKIYWIDGKDETTPTVSQFVTPDQEFYINKNHQLVLTYKQYTVAPGSMGVPEFVIPTKVIKNLLVNENYLNEK